MKEPIARFLILMKEMKDGFAVLKRKGGNYYYEQPSFSFALPSLGFIPPTGILLDNDIKHNKEVITEIAKFIDYHIYFYPDKLGMKVIIYDEDTTKLLDDRIKLISSNSLSTKIQIRICYWRLRFSKNPIYKLFEGI